MSPLKPRGFTLIEVLLVIAILAILAGIVIIAINPSKQLGRGQNTQRWNDVRTILDAVHQYSIDHSGELPGSGSEIPEGGDCNSVGADICRTGVSCSGISLEELTDDGVYIVDMPTDPTGATSEITGYLIAQNGNGRVSVCAPSAVDDEIISVLR